MGYNCFLWSVSFFAIGLLLESCGLVVPTLIVWLLAAEHLVHLVDEQRMRLWKLLGFIFIGFGCSVALPLLGLVLMAVEQEKIFEPKVRELILDMEDSLVAWTRIENFRFYVGANNMVMVQDMISKLYTWVREITQGEGLYFGTVIKAKRMRPNGVSPIIEEVDNRGMLSVGEVLHMEEECLATSRKAVMIGLVVLVVLLYKTPATFAFMGFAALLSMWNTAADTYLVAGADKGSIEDGTYELVRTMFGMPLACCIGVCTGGVMHAPYHGTHRNTLIVGGRSYNPYFISIESDLVTWGGMPRFVKVEANDEIIVNCESWESRRSVRVQVAIHEEIRGFAWIGQSKPGESGSGIWKRAFDEEGLSCIQLVGLAGRWAGNADSKTEISIRPPVTEDTVRVRTGLNRICLHPGAGKTRSMVPALIEEFLHGAKAGKIVLVGPTRVVARELYNAIQRRYPGRVGLSMKGENGARNPTARIQVTTHATFIKMVHTAAREVLNIGLMIIDEAHVSNTSTVMCNRYAEHVAEMGKSAVLMSATFEDEMDTRSNFPIKDVKITPGKEEEIIEESVNENKRVLWFVPAFDGPKGAERRAAALNRMGIKALALGRPTYATIAPRLNDPEVQVIVTTNIAECGLNIDCDVVVNTALDYDFYHDDGVITGRTERISQASWIQRRGRVGRKCNGTHYYTSDATDSPKTKACKIDADLLMNGRTWNKQLSGEAFQLTDRQFSVWLEKQYAPRLISLLYDADGNLKKGKHLEDSIQDWLKGGPICACSCNSCPKKAKWFDMRHHDKLCNLLGVRSTSTQEVELIY